MEAEKQKSQKSMSSKENLEDFLSQFNLKIIKTSRKINKPDVDSLWENHKEFIKNNKLILKSQQIFRSKKHNVFTENVNEIALSVNDDKKYNQ